jgi:hypothetical protein
MIAQLPENLRFLRTLCEPRINFTQGPQRTQRELGC